MKTALDSNRAISAMKWHRRTPFLGRSGIYPKRRRATDGASAFVTCLLIMPRRSLAGGVQAIAAARGCSAACLRLRSMCPEHRRRSPRRAGAGLALQLAGIGQDGVGSPLLRCTISCSEAMVIAWLRGVLDHACWPDREAVQKAWRHARSDGPGRTPPGTDRESSMMSKAAAISQTGEGCSC